MKNRKIATMISLLALTATLTGCATHNTSAPSPSPTPSVSTSATPAAEETSTPTDSSTPPEVAPIEDAPADENLGEEIVIPSVPANAEAHQVPEVLESPIEVPLTQEEEAVEVPIEEYAPDAPGVIATEPASNK